MTEPKLNAFQTLLLRRDVFYPNQSGVGTFTPFFLGGNRQITRNFVADDSALVIFHRYLEQQNIPYTEADLTANQDWIENEIKREVFTSAFGLPEGYKIDLENDPQVLKAIDSLPQARSLYDNVRAITAQRGVSPVTQP